jgi:hypothetical protein
MVVVQRLTEAIMKTNSNMYMAMVCRARHQSESTWDELKRGTSVSSAWAAERFPGSFQDCHTVHCHIQYQPEFHTRDTGPE